MKKKVMVVDDSKFIFEEMKFFLDGSNFEIVSYCQEGEGCVECYRNSQPDIVTMDIVLPGIDGFEAACNLLREFPEATIIMVSSLAYDDTIDKATEIGAKGFLFKPIEKSTMLELLSSISPQ